MRNVAVIFLIVWYGCAQAEVYKWTDKHGEVHFGEHPPSGANAEMVITKQQIRRTEKADEARPEAPPLTPEEMQAIDQEAREQAEQCQRFKLLLQDFMLNVAKTNPALATATLGYNLGYLVNNGSGDSWELMGYAEIQANIRKYCRE